jgi:serine/threonine protein kinase
LRRRFGLVVRNPSLDEALASHIFRQVVAGLHYLHSRNILHRDIKVDILVYVRREHKKNSVCCD